MSSVRGVGGFQSANAGQNQERMQVENWGDWPWDKARDNKGNRNLEVKMTCR